MAMPSTAQRCENVCSHAVARVNMSFASSSVPFAIARDSMAPHTRRACQLSPSGSDVECPPLCVPSASWLQPESDNEVSADSSDAWPANRAPPSKSHCSGVLVVASSSSVAPTSKRKWASSSSASCSGVLAVPPRVRAGDAGPPLKSIDFATHLLRIASSGAPAKTKITAYERAGSDMARIRTALLQGCCCNAACFSKISPETVQKVAAIWHTEMTSAQRLGFMFAHYHLSHGSLLQEEETIEGRMTWRIEGIQHVYTPTHVLLQWPLTLIRQ